MDKQIFKTLFSNKNFFNKIIFMLNQNNIKPIKYSILKKLILNHSDIEIFLFLHNRFKKSNRYKNYISLKKNLFNTGSLNKYNLLNNNFDLQNKIILDVGTEDGYFLDLLNTKSIAYGINIKTDLYLGYDYIDKSNIKIYDGINIPLFNNKKYDIITCFMVIHHMSNKEKTLQSIYNSLNLNGYFIFKEHDIDNILTKKYVDFLHFFYELIENDIFNYKYYLNYDEYYISKSDLHKLLSDIGFIKVDILPMNISSPYGSSRSYYSCYTKY